MSHASLPTCSGKLLPCPQGQVSPEAIKRPCPAQASSVFRPSLLKPSLGAAWKPCQGRCPDEPQPSGH